MKKTFTILGLLVSAFAIGQNCNVICNGGFDSTNIAGSSVAVVNATIVPCWKTTSTDNKIEVWSNGYNGINSYSGSQFIEANATMHCTVYQDFTANAGDYLSISFAHRARGNSVIDSIQVLVGPVGGPYTSLGRFGDGSSAWVYRTLNYSVPTGAGSNYSLRFTTLYVGNGNNAIGNFLDAVKICDSPVGIEEHGLNESIAIGPNPATNDFNIKFLNKSLIGADMSLKLYDLQGKLVKEYSSKINSELVTFDVRELIQGVYYYQGTIDKQGFSGKISVVK
jgi:hypothetical protein